MRLKEYYVTATVEVSRYIEAVDSQRAEEMLLDDLCFEYPELDFEVTEVEYA